jgi:hypothetical protein
MKEEGRRKKEEGGRRFIYVDSDPNSKQATYTGRGINKNSGVYPIKFA